MPKEKIKKKNENYNIYYETLGIVLIGLSLIILTRLGSVGLWLNIIFKILFGDWYYLLLIMIFIQGCIFLKKRKFIDFKSIRVNGFFLFLLSLMGLSHYSIYQYAKNHEDNALFQTINLYKYYINDPDLDYMLGGGIISAIIYQGLVFLIGEAGVILVFSLTLILSLIFLSGNSIISFKNQIKRFKFKFKINFNGIINYISSIKIKQKKVGLNMLSDINLSMNHKIEEKISNDVKMAIEGVFRKMNYEFYFVNLYVGYQASRYVYKINIKDLNIIYNNLKQIINDNIAISYNDELIIEVNHKFRELLTLKRLLLQNNEIPLGLEIDGRIINYDFQKNSNMIISGAYNSGIRNFIRCFITSIIMRRVNHQIAMLDIKEEFYELNMYHNLHSYYNKVEDIDIFFNEIIKEVERRIELSYYFKANDYNELNKMIKENSIEEELKRIFIYINGFEVLIKNKNFDQELHYLISIGSKCGIHIIIINRISNAISPLIKGLIDTKILFKCDNINQSIELLDNDKATILDKNGDMIIKIKDEEYRVQAPFISKDEYLKII